jgi:hypothetical protein
MNTDFAESVPGLLGLLMVLGIKLALISPLAALTFAIVSYARHRKRVEPGHRFPVIGYVLAIVVCGALGGLLGLYFGVELACSATNPGNLCGIWGFLVVGPLSCALAIFLVTIYLMRPRSSSPQSK